jgi:hypothetical protein
MEPNKVAVFVRDPENQMEGLRSCIGLNMEMIEAHLFVIGEVRVPEDQAEIYLENLELLDDLEGRHYTDNRANVEKWGYFKYVSLDDMARMVRDYDLIIPF